MIDLGSTEFFFPSDAMTEGLLKSNTTRLFEQWDSYLGDVLALPDYSLHLQVDEGSVRGVGIVGAAVYALYMGIGNYGDAVQGLKTIGDQVNAAGEYLAERAPAAFGCPGVEPRTKRSGGAIASLQRLFVRVQRGDISPEEATILAEKVLGQDAAASPDFVSELEKAFRNCPRFHEQVSLPFEGDALETFERQKPTRESPPLRTPAIHVAPSTHIRVEVWRESKNKRRKARVKHV